MNYTATQIAKKLDISRSYLYYLKENGLIEIELNEKGRPMWTEEVYDRLKEYIKKNNVEEKPEVQELPYKTTKINNRRYLGNKYIENDILHNHNQDKFIYRYPMVQYKIIDKTAMIIGIGKASNLVANIGIIEDEILIDDKLINIYEKSILRLNQNYGCKDDYIEYKFITPWIALNQNNISKYKNSNNVDKEEILKKILVGNIISMSKGLDYTVKEKIHCWINLKEKEVIIKGIKHIGFVGEFKVNFDIPDYLGLGKSVSKGFGTIKKVG